MNKPLDRLNIFSLKGVQMRTFHITWLMFFVCFFGWFGLAPLMPTIRVDLGLTKAQVGNIIIASVAATVLARLVVGKLCDTWGPRKTAVRLLLAGSVPVFLVGLAHDYTSFLLFRLCIGVIGASFVITQFHTSMMFAPAIKGTANAVTGGWGNLGGGVTNMVMPLVFSAIVGMGFTPHAAWRYAMILPGVMMLGIAFLYYKYTTDTPEGNFSERLQKPPTDWTVLADPRIWVLMLAYAMCFGMELTFDNVASLHFVDTFHLTQAAAGFWAGVFGFMNLFARALGGIFSDKAGKRWGMKGKGYFLAGALLLEGTGLILFSMAGSLAMAIGLMLFFALFLKMANGGTFGIVPFVNTKNVGLVSGIVGAGGNLGGVLFGFLFKSSSLTYAQAFRWIGLTILAVSAIVALTRFAVKAKRTPSPSLVFAEEEVFI
ncbi:MFS transporter [Dinghuibacter silviterrae]|uniref:NNP family nitrate/nitrite transporter-like MFS transporter n=1 Tax=Dinghuibacter silviterrae TaxID=1539049 RepID=A0A4R8DSZ6_9BACT|nr:MFS transporter [Dinghuibacter silviterrae]TDX01008.1 NNP family nitrate/nitrite transporter-like MFS transporter [Dinghuibacter silviterrae]